MEADQNPSELKDLLENSGHFPSLPVPSRTSDASTRIVSMVSDLDGEAPRWLWCWWVAGSCDSGGRRCGRRTGSEAPGRCSGSRTTTERPLSSGLYPTTPLRPGPRAGPSHCTITPPVPPPPTLPHPSFFYTLKQPPPLVVTPLHSEAKFNCINEDLMLR